MKGANIMIKDHVTGFQHLGLPVTNIEQSLSFYEQLGFTVIMSTTLPADAEPIQVRMMKLGDFVLELYQLTGAEREEIASRTDGHVDHFALDVDDIEATLAAVRAAGLETIEDAPVFLPFWEQGIRYFIVRGPDGERVEFCERIK